MLISTDYDLNQVQDMLWGGAEDTFREIRDLIDNDEFIEEFILEYFSVSYDDPIDLIELNDLFRHNDIDELKELFGVEDDEDDEVEESTNFYKTYKSLKERRNRLCENREHLRRKLRRL